MALLQITIIPMGTSTPNPGDHIPTMQKRLSDMGVHFVLNDMGTLIEGEAAELLTWRQSLMKGGAVGVVTHDRRDRNVKIGDTTQSIISRIRSTEPGNP